MIRGPLVDEEAPPLTCCTSTIERPLPIGHSAYTVSPKVMGAVRPDGSSVGDAGSCSRRGPTIGVARMHTQFPEGVGSARTSPSAGPQIRRKQEGQALVEFAVVLPVLVLVIGRIIQFGAIFWSQQTLTQVVRDTGRWAATQTTCNDVGAVAATANSIAANSSLFGYGGGWSSEHVRHCVDQRGHRVLECDIRVVPPGGQPGRLIRHRPDRPPDPSVLPVRAR